MIKITKVEYSMAGPGQVSIVVDYDVGMMGGEVVTFTADLYGGPWPYSALRGAVDDYAGSLARNGYDAGLEQDLAVYRGALGFLTEHGTLEGAV
jgi:hypothetical protein